MTIPKLTLLLLFLIANATCGLISSTNNDKIVLDEEFFRKDFEVLEAEHTIVDLVLPLNYPNENKDAEDVTLFYFEADIKQDSIDYKGMSILKDGKVKKLLENGRDAVSGDKGTKEVFFAATDGLYSYDSEKNEAKKYGFIDDNLIAITKVPGSDILYVLNNEHDLFKVTKTGNEKLWIRGVKNAKQIVTKPDGTLLYVDSKNDIYAMKDTRITKINGLPDSKDFVKLLRPIRLNYEMATEDFFTLAIVDNTLYEIKGGMANKVEIENLNDKKFEIKLKVKPTSYAMNVLGDQYFALDNKLYRIDETVIRDLFLKLNGLKIVTSEAKHSL